MAAPGPGHRGSRQAHVAAQGSIHGPCQRPWPANQSGRLGQALQPLRVAVHGRRRVDLLVAGGATFAAFPQWYATMFSGFYLALLLILTELGASPLDLFGPKRDRSTGGDE
jgi:hypothetical protein